MSEINKWKEADFIKYYFIEDYLFNTVTENFRSRGYLEPEEFFAIVIWKSNRAKTKVKQGLLLKGVTVHDLTAALTKEPTLEDKVKLLIEISFIGLPMASAILAVCYPDDFTVVDYRAIVSLKSLGQVVLSNPSENLLAYLAYNQICKERAIEVGCSLRNFDRYLWAKVFYEGIKGLKVLAHGV